MIYLTALVRVKIDEEVYFTNYPDEIDIDLYEIRHVLRNNTEVDMEVGDSDLLSMGVQPIDIDWTTLKERPVRQSKKGR